MAEVPPFSMDFQPDEDDFNIFEIISLVLEEEVPVNQSSMLGNDQAGQNILMGNDVDSIQQTTQFPTPFPDQTMITMGGLDGASSSWINQNGPNWPQTPSSSGQFPYQLDQALITPNLYGPQCSAMLPEPSQTLRSPQYPPHNLQVSGDPNQGQVDQASVIPHIDNMQQKNLMPRNFGKSTRLQNSFIHQPQLGHVYMTSNATTSQHGGFNQPAPRIQCIPNQGQVDQADMIPNIDNMQQENFVPRNLGKSTRSQMENLQVRGLQNQTARPNASNPGPDSSLQSQNRGLNSQQVQRARSRDPFWNYVEEKDDGSMICIFCRRKWANKIPISRFKWHLSGEEGRNVKICSGVTKEVQEEALKAMHGSNKRHKNTACSINVNDRGISTCPQEQNIENENMGGDIGWCLDVLVKIMECRQKTHQVVLPIFYDTDPSDVRKQTGSYAKAFDKHEEHFKEEMEKVIRWREAVTQAANLSGRVLHKETNGYEAEFIKRVVSDVACKLGNKTLHVAT